MLDLDLGIHQHRVIPPTPCRGMHSLADLVILCEDLAIKSIDERKKGSSALSVSALAVCAA
jgi:hypothetical protein